jgi:hypothetical protein
MERRKNSTQGIDKIASQNMDGPNSFGVHIVKPLQNDPIFIGASLFVAQMNVPRRTLVCARNKIL